NFGDFLMALSSQGKEPPGKSGRFRTSLMTSFSSTRSAAALQPGVLGLELLQALGVGHAHPAELAPLQVVRRLAEAVLAAELLDRQPCLGLTQEAGDLFLGEALLHVQSPFRWGLESRSLRYSKAGTSGASWCLAIKRSG